MPLRTGFSGTLNLCENSIPVDVGLGPNANEGEFFIETKGPRDTYVRKYYIPKGKSPPMGIEVRQALYGQLVEFLSKLDEFKWLMVGSLKTEVDKLIEMNLRHFL